MISIPMVSVTMSATSQKPDVCERMCDMVGCVSAPCLRSVGVIEKSSGGRIGGRLDAGRGPGARGPVGLLGSAFGPIDHNRVGGDKGDACVGRDGRGAARQR